MIVHGLTITESASAARALGAVSLAVIGIIATATAPAGAATEALDAAFPLNTPVLVTSVDAAAGKAGTGGTLKAALEAIGDEASPLVIVVRVAEGEDQAETDANVIGTTDGTTFTGLQALAVAEQRLGVKPQIIAAPGLDSQAVVEEMVSIAKKLRGFVYAAAEGDSVAEALTYRENFGHRELMLIWPGTNATFPGDIVARAIGLRAQIDETVGWHKTISNVPLVGVTGLDRDISFDLTDPSTDAGVLNGGEITTIIRQNGFRLWGNRTTANPQTNPSFVFESAVRTSHALQEIVAQVVSPFIDQPMTIGLVKDLLETGNARFRQLAVQGVIQGAEMFFDADQNSPQELAAGRPRFRIQFTPVAPLENPNVDLVITDFYYTDFADQLV